MYMAMNKKIHKHYLAWCSDVMAIIIMHKQIIGILYTMITILSHI